MKPKRADGARQYLIPRNGIWQYRRRVPTHLASLDPRGEVRMSTHQADETQATIIADRMNRELEAFWLSLGAGEAAVRDNAVEVYERAVRLARTYGVAYRPVSELAGVGLGELLGRLEVFEQQHLMKAPHAKEAILGGAAKPALLLSQLPATYEEHCRDKLRSKSPDQIRKWKNPRRRAVENFIEVVSDKALGSITRDEALDFRAWWLDRVMEEGYDPGSANKDLGHLSKMLRVISDAWRLGLVNPFSGLRLEGERHNPRIAYEAAFVRERILVPGALSSMNDEARGITIMVATTGLRPSEVCTLDEKRILLEEKIPFLKIRPDGRELKTRHSSRDMPLLGLALETMREFKQGFPRYRNSPDALSATVNKALGAAGLRPTPDHTLYSLRHTFKDRLIALEAPPRVQDALMGHAVGEIEYGSGPSLEQRALWLGRVWE